MSIFCNLNLLFAQTITAVHVPQTHAIQKLNKYSRIRESRTGNLGRKTFLHFLFARINRIKLFFLRH
jgi:hypothetical protein